MIDKNLNYNKYFLKLISDFDEATLLSPNMNGQKTPKLSNVQLKINGLEIRNFCKNNSISDNILFLAAASIALNKFNFSNKNLIFHEDNLIFTTNFKNRQIPIRDYLLQIQKDYDENLKYSKFSLDKIIHAYDLKPEFYYSFNEDLDYNLFKYKYDFYLNVQIEEGFILSASYNDQLYSLDYVHLFLKSIETIINQILSSNISELRLSDIHLVKESGKIQFEEIQTPLIHKRFEKQVELGPDKLALISNGEKLTYRELNERANRIANALIKKGVEPRENILLMLPRTADLIASIIGILKAGCAYIPIDMEYPKERIAYICENSNADYIITDNEIGDSLKIGELLKEENNENPNLNIDADDLAYIIYTSGSTGKPKGVMGSHRNLANAYSKSQTNNLHDSYAKMKRNLGIT